MTRLHVVDPRHRRGAFLFLVTIAGCTALDADTPGHVYTILDTEQGAFVSDDQTTALLPAALAIDSRSGTLYVGDWNSYQLYARDATGSIRTIAGSGERGDPVDGPARESPLGIVGGVLLDGEDGLYFTDVYGSYAEHLDLRTGQLARFGGTGTRQQYAGDGGLALEAPLSMPSALAWLADGRVLLADQENEVLRTIDPSSGLIAHFAGRCVVDWQGPCDAPVACPGSEKVACSLATCGEPCSAAPGPALATTDDARFGFLGGDSNGPLAGTAVAADGTVLVSDPFNHRIRAIRPDGHVETLVDGLRSPGALALAADGTLYIANQWDSCLYALAPDATLTVIAGTCGTKGFAGDGGLATKALFHYPLALALDEAVRRLYVSDAGNNRVRYLAL